MWVLYSFDESRVEDFPLLILGPSLASNIIIFGLLMSHAMVIVQRQCCVGGDLVGEGKGLRLDDLIASLNSSFACIRPAIVKQALSESH